MRLQEVTLTLLALGLERSSAYQVVSTSISLLFHLYLALLQRLCKATTIACVSCTICFNKD
jgi:hypothetical protein